MAWHLRVFELPNGRWSCRWSTTTFDEHDTLEAALAHLRAFTDDIGPSQVYLHHHAGKVSLLAEFD